MEIKFLARRNQITSFCVIAFSFPATRWLDSTFFGKWFIFCAHKMFWDVIEYLLNVLYCASSLFPFCLICSCCTVNVDLHIHWYRFLFFKIWSRFDDIKTICVSLRLLFWDRRRILSSFNSYRRGPSSLLDNFTVTVLVSRLNIAECSSFLLCLNICLLLAYAAAAANFCVFVEG